MVRLVGDVRYLSYRVKSQSFVDGVVQISHRFQVFIRRLLVRTVLFDLLSQLLYNLWLL